MLPPTAAFSCHVACHMLALCCAWVDFRNTIPEKPPSHVSPPDPPCSFWPRSWLKPTPPPTTSPGPQGRPELRAPTASAPTSDGWPNMSLPSGCRAPTSTSWPHLTSSTRPWRSVSLRFCFSTVGLIMEKHASKSCGWHVTDALCIVTTKTWQ